MEPEDKFTPSEQEQQNIEEKIDSESDVQHQTTVNKKQTFSLLTRIFAFLYLGGISIGVILFGAFFLHGDSVGSCKNRCEAISLSFGPLAIAMGVQLIFIVFKSLILRKKIKLRDWILFLIVAILAFIYVVIYFFIL